MHTQPLPSTHSPVKLTKPATYQSVASLCSSALASFLLVFFISRLVRFADHFLHLHQP